MADEPYPGYNLDMDKLEELSGRDDEIFEIHPGWAFSTELYYTKFYLFPSKEKQHKLRKDRNIRDLIIKIKEDLKLYVQKAALSIDANWLDLNNDLIRKELVWDMNGYLDQMFEDGLIEDYQVTCDNTNNPREIFETGDLVAEALVFWDQEHKASVYKFRATKKGVTANAG